jgi:purine-nucleoside phosphorylase
LEFYILPRHRFLFPPLFIIIRSGNLLFTKQSYLPILYLNAYNSEIKIYIFTPSLAIMSIHISAKPGEIAPIVLMPGDPLRAKHIADNYLENTQLVNQTRNVFFYTGNYKGKRLTIGASGMGCPSIGIYSYELYNEYEVECIMRIGTCGAYYTSINLFDVINASAAFSESTYAKYAFEYSEDGFEHQGKAYEVINTTAKQLNIPILTGPIHSGDPFYRIDPAIPKIVVDNKCLAAEMEAFALFANAKYFNKTAACLLTVSDIIPARTMITAEQREKSLHEMTKLALESTLGI